jgi:hypothetical protein
MMGGFSPGCAQRAFIAGLFAQSENRCPGTSVSSLRPPLLNWRAFGLVFAAGPKPRPFVQPGKAAAQPWIELCGLSSTKVLSMRRTPASMI